MKVVRLLIVAILACVLAAPFLMVAPTKVAGQSLPATPPGGGTGGATAYFPEDTIVWILGESDGEEKIKIVREEGNTFEFEVEVKLEYEEQWKGKKYPIQLFYRAVDSEGNEQVIPVRKNVAKLSKEEFDLEIEWETVITITDPQEFAGAFIKFGNSTTYAAGSNLITVVGYTPGSPASSEVIYQADVAGGWGVFFKQGDSEYYSTANITIGDGTETYFVDEDIALVVGSAAAGRYFDTKINSDTTFTRSYLGVPDSQTGNANRWYGDSWFYDSIIEAGGYLAWGSGNHSWNNSVVYSSTWYPNPQYAGGNKTTIIDTTLTSINGQPTAGGSAESELIGLLFNGYGFASWLPSANNNRLVDSEIATSSGYHVRITISAYYAVLVDTIFDDTKLNFGFANNYLEDRHTFSVLVTDVDGVALVGATITIKDNTDATVLETATGGDGYTPVAEILYRKFEGTSETETIYSPHTIRIVKEGYTVYEAGIIFDRKMIDMSIALGAQEDAVILLALILLPLGLTIAMFATRNSMLGFPAALFWAIFGAYVYTQSTIPWGDWQFYLAFSSLLGMTTFCALGAYGLRERRDTIAEVEMDEEGEEEGPFVDEQKPRLSKRTEELRDRAKQRKERRGGGGL